jgi:hypothetical protein
MNNMDTFITCIYWYLGINVFCTIVLAVLFFLAINNDDDEK